MPRADAATRTPYDHLVMAVAAHTASGRPDESTELGAGETGSSSRSAAVKPAPGTRQPRRKRGTK